MNILVATPGRLLQHMDQTVGFESDNLQMLGESWTSYFIFPNLMASQFWMRRIEYQTWDSLAHSQRSYPTYPKPVKPSYSAQPKQNQSPPSPGYHSNHPFPYQPSPQPRSPAPTLPHKVSPSIIQYVHSTRNYQYYGPSSNHTSNPKSSCSCQVANKSALSSPPFANYTRVSHYYISTAR